MIFLGLASNYKFSAALRHLFAHGSIDDSEALRWNLADYCQAPAAQVELYQTGRSALAAGLKALLPPGSPVLIPGLTCIAVVRAVKAAGLEPVYIDIDPETLQYDWQALEKTLADLAEIQKNPQTAGLSSKTKKTTPKIPVTNAQNTYFDQKTPESSAETAKFIDKNKHVCYNGGIVVQNTLGLPLDMSKLAPLAEKYHFALIEDLAHSAGRVYPDGRPVGSVGAMAAFSFGKGKAIDTIEGGALVLRESGLSAPVSPERPPRLSDRLRDRWYPFFGWLIRAGYHVGLGKIFTGVLLKIHWIARSANAPLDLNVRLTHWQAKLALPQLQTLTTTPLREHDFVADRSALLAALRRQGYHLEEIWYDTPVAPARYMAEADFPAARCPRTQQISETIINYPTWYPEKKLAPVREFVREWKKTHPLELSQNNQKSEQSSQKPDQVQGQHQEQSVSEPKSKDSQPSSRSLSQPKPESKSQPQLEPKSSSRFTLVSTHFSELTDSWQKVIQQFPEANFLQSPAWARTNELIGHQVRIAYLAGRAWCLMIIKNAKRGRYLEVPAGPLLDWRDTELVTAVFIELRRLARAERCVFIRFRPQLLAKATTEKTTQDGKNISGKTDQIPVLPDYQQLFRDLGAQPAPMHLHAEHTIILDLKKPESELLADLRRQTRYEVRRAAKLGIEVSWQNSEAIFREFHQVQAATAARQHFVPPDLKTLLAERAAFTASNQPDQSSSERTTFADSDNPSRPLSERADFANSDHPSQVSSEQVRLYVAKTASGEPIAYGLILISGREADYYEAASTDLNRKLPGAYALQWRVIQDLQKLGLERYNLWGIAPPGVENHRYSGVTTFKSGFGGESIEFVSAHDLVLRRARYLPDLVIERLRKKVRNL